MKEHEGLDVFEAGAIIQWCAQKVWGFYKDGTNGIDKA